MKNKLLGFVGLTVATTAAKVISDKINAKENAEKAAREAELEQLRLKKEAEREKRLDAYRAERAAERDRRYKEITSSPNFKRNVATLLYSLGIIALSAIIAYVKF